MALALPEDDPDFPYLSFAVGCFHFGANEDTFDGSAANHVQRIRERLDQIPQITRVRINDPGLGWFESNLPYGLEDGGQPFPAVRGLRIDFRLELTPDDQKRFYPWDPRDPEALFIDVSIRQGPAVPVAFVVPRTRRQHPARSVTFTWHALRELVPADDGPLRFDMRGPSPAHLEAFLLPLVEVDENSAPSAKFEFDRVNLGVGYVWATFAYDPRTFISIESAAEGLFQQLERPAGLFYEIAGAGRLLGQRWEALEALRGDLVRLETGQGLGAFLRRPFRSARVLHNLAIGLTEFEAEAAAQQSRYAEARRDLDEVSDPPFLGEEIDERLRTAFRFHTERLSAPLSWFETRRLARGQNRTALASAILAAVAGATLALWVSARNEEVPRTTVTTTTRVITQTITTPRPRPPGPRQSPSRP